MKSSARAVVIGGGVVGASVLYHLAKIGWRDVLLLEKSELTSGSTWHAAGGMHTFNGEANISRLQKYTIDLYREIEAASGQSCGLHPNGGLMLAATPVTSSAPCGAPTVGTATPPAPPMPMSRRHERSAPKPSASRGCSRSRRG